MMMQKPSRYEHDEQIWNTNGKDTNSACKEPVVRCPKGYPGHKVFWLNKKVTKYIAGELHYDVIVRINHAHFVNDKDVGRHVDDVVEHMWINAKYTVTTTRINFAKLPEWMRNENEMDAYF